MLEVVHILILKVKPLLYIKKVVNNRLYKVSLSIYLLKEPGKELTLSGLNIIKTKITSKEGFKGIL